jgi:hypothetical protein
MPLQPAVDPAAREITPRRARLSRTAPTSLNVPRPPEIDPPATGGRDVAHVDRAASSSVEPRSAPHDAHPPASDDAPRALARRASVLPSVDAGSRNANRTELEPSMSKVLEAVRRATSWIEAGQRRQGRHEDDGRVRPIAHTRDARTASRHTAPVTHLEIGRIEVEVVPPAKPAAPSPRATSTPTSRAPLVTPGPAFGWRQR